MTGRAVVCEQLARFQTTIGSVSCSQNAGDCCVFVVVVGKLGQPGRCAGQILFPNAIAELYAQGSLATAAAPPANYITLYESEHRV